MASTSNIPSPTSSASTSVPTKWDVFISFRGKDTRYTFSDFLYDSLKRHGIRTFRDDPELRSGEFISDALIQAIEESKIYIVVFSENYASSRWCLDELVEIESMDRLVIPVFYYIEPMVVRHQIGSFHEAFREHENRYNADSSQADVINKIVNRTLQEVNPVTLDVAKYEVGLDSRVEDIATLLSNVTEGVIKIGLYGMGGVGKTTLAKAVYNKNYNRFKGGCFLEKVGENSQTREGIAGLQQKLVNDVLKCTNFTIDNADYGIELIRARICSTKLLVVIDDLDSKDQFDFLVGPYALGSTIIITTRDEGLLDSIDVEAKYKVNELGDVESRQLFCQHAFGGGNIMPDTFRELSKEILKRAAGLPLALKVCGSALFKKSEEGWRDFIDELRRVSIVNVEKILLISFNALDTPKLKDMFLDIACFYKGYKQDEAVKIMETCYTSVNYNIDILRKKCLLTVSDKRFGMHDLILDMGRKIACNNSPHVFGKHSRLWESKFIQEVLKKNKGTEAIEGIIPSNFRFPRHFVPDSEYEYRQEVFNTASKRNHFSAETFKRMSKLRFLYLNNVKLTGSFEHTFKDLRWLYWERCPLNCLPSDFKPQKLVFLALLGSEMRTLWRLNTVGTVFKNLKTLDMSYSCNLIEAPDFTRFRCLETLNLYKCERLEEVHIVNGSLLRLVSLNLGWCKNLKSLPDSICNLTALKSLNIDGCLTLKAIPLNVGNIESLAELKACYLNIFKLPQSIGRLSKLIQLNLSSCKNLKTLPDTICNLRSLNILNIKRCSSLKALPIELGNLESLVSLDAWELPNISKLPDSIRHIKSLESLGLVSCSNLLSIGELPSSLNAIILHECTALESLPNLSNMKQLRKLVLTSCRGLREIQGLEELTSIRTLYLEGCNLSLLKSTLTKRFFQIYSGFGHQVTVLAPSSMFPDWISQSPDRISETAEFDQYELQQHRVLCPISTVSLDLPSNPLHNFFAVILCSKFSRRGYATRCVVTTTNRFLCGTNYQIFPFDDDDQEFSFMDIIPTTELPLTEDDHRVEFKAILIPYGLAEILGIHLLYKPENTIIDECTPST